MEDMLSLMRHDLRIARLGSLDVRGESDHFCELRRLVCAHDVLYPGIDIWFDKKVKDGLRNNERIAFVGYFNQKPAVSAILKRHARTKICHIHVCDDLRGNHLGEIFTILMALEVRTLSKNVHITMPESLWERRKGFFTSFGFGGLTINPAQYRRGDEELRVEAPYCQFWQCALGKVGKLSEFFSSAGLPTGFGVLMSIQPKYAERIVRGQKKVELRRKFNRKWEGETVRIYSSSPVRGIVGEARIQGVEQNSPEVIWGKYEKDIGCSRTEFEKYVRGAKTISAIVLGEVKEYPGVLSLTELEHLTGGELCPPQSYLDLRRSVKWAEAVTVGVLIQNSFRTGVMRGSVCGAW